MQVQLVQWVQQGLPEPPVRKDLTVRMEPMEQV